MERLRIPEVRHARLGSPANFQRKPSRSIKRGATTSLIGFIQAPRRLADPDESPGERARTLKSRKGFKLQWCHLNEPFSAVEPKETRGRHPTLRNEPSDSAPSLAETMKNARCDTNEASLRKKKLRVPPQRVEF